MEHYCHLVYLLSNCLQTRWYSTDGHIPSAIFYCVLIENWEKWVSCGSINRRSKLKIAPVFLDNRPRHLTPIWAVRWVTTGDCWCQHECRYVCYSNAAALKIYLACTLSDAEKKADCPSHHNIYQSLTIKRKATYKKVQLSKSKKKRVKSQCNSKSKLLAIFFPPAKIIFS